MKWKGVRKVAFGALALLFLGGGLAAVTVWPAGQPVFGAFSTAVCTITGLVMAGNIGEHAASRAQEKAP